MRVTFCTLVFILFQSCITEYNLDDFEPQKEYSVSGFAKPGVPAEIFVGRIGSLGNIPPLENPANLKVTISWIQNDEELLDSLHFETDRFVGNIDLEHSIVYNLEVLTAEGQILKAKTSIPPPADTFLVNMRFPAGFIQLENFTGPYSRFSFRFNQALTSGQFYESMIFEIDEKEGQPIYNLLYCLNNDNEILNQNLPSNYLPYFLFETGQAAETPLTLNFDNIQGNPLLSKFIFRLSSVSQDYFLYKKSLYQHLDALEYADEFDGSSLFFPDIFKQVRPVYSNIEGGRGIFAGYNPTQIIVNCNLTGNACD